MAPEAGLRRVRGQAPGRSLDGNVIGFVTSFVTIDAAGRLVVPKAVRDRLRLRPGMRLGLIEENGRLVLTPDRPEPRLVERDGFLVLDTGAHAVGDVDHRAVREERLRRLADDALNR